jgi:hypothetical protein
LTIPAVNDEPTARQSSTDVRDRIGETVESLASYGDLLELPSQDGDRGRVLYLAPPTFVRASSSVVFLLGGRPDAVDILPGDLRRRVEYVNHTRRLVENDGASLADRLLSYGLLELSNNLWLSPPQREAPLAAVERADRALKSKPTRGEVAGLSLLDPAESPTYYRGRWRSPRRESGRFVARREQLYGADLWTYVGLVDGEVSHLVDLPLDSRTPDARGCDEAWQLQMAIDVVNGHPQRFRLRPSPPDGWIVVDFFSPLPRWARRKFDVLGEEVAPFRSLLSYRFTTTIGEAINSCLRDELWLAQDCAR